MEMVISCYSCALLSRYGKHSQGIWRMAGWRRRAGNEAEIRESKEESGAADAVWKRAGV